MAPSAKAQRFVNKWGARLIPLILVGLVGYATWVIISLIAVHYLLKPPNGGTARTGAAVAVIVLYFILMLPMSAAYLRTLYLVVTNPGYVPLPQSSSHKRQQSSRGSNMSQQLDAEKMADRIDQEMTTPSQTVGYLDRAAVYGGRLSPPEGLEKFYARNVFECEIDGLPRWCSVCKNWKPDRSHHSSEVGRCVYKLDHYCPWAGGIVSETSFKPFIQFCVYGALYCVYILVVAAYFTAEQQRVSNLYNINWIVIIVISGLFCIFSTGMGVNSVRAAFLNSTTVDNLTRRSRMHHLCVLVDSPVGHGDYSNANAQPAAPYPTMTYPLSDPNESPDSNSLPEQRRTFAILATPTGSNPYLLPKRLDNFKTVMGEHFWDWILPIRRSPCCSHAQDDARFGIVMYKLGPVIERVMRDVGLVPRNGNTLLENSKEKVGGRKLSKRNQRGDADRTRAHAHPGSQMSHQAPQQQQQQQHDPPGSVTMARLEEGWTQTGQA